MDVQNVAIVEKREPVNLYVTNSDMSSSVLKLKKHKIYYPDIWESYVIACQGETIDGIVGKSTNPKAYNFLTIDIQGAELLALEGAQETLNHIHAINVEVNFEELYAGCALISDIDVFLAARGFTRVATVCSFHPSRGDAFYLATRTFFCCNLSSLKDRRFIRGLQNRTQPRRVLSSFLRFDAVYRSREDRMLGPKPNTLIVNPCAPPFHLVVYS